MKIYKVLIVAALALTAMSACKDEAANGAGNPVITSPTIPAAAQYGDSVAFSASVADDIPLSTLKAQLFFGEDMVNEAVIRTKTGGEYSGKFWVPYFKSIPNATATVKFVLQNIEFGTATVDLDFPLTRPDWPNIIFVAEDGSEQIMTRTALYQYAYKGDLDPAFKGYFKSPDLTPAEITAGVKTQVKWGMKSGAVSENSTSLVSFSTPMKGEASITFNTQTYATGPNFKMTWDGAQMEAVSNGVYAVAGAFTQGQKVALVGIDDLESWTIAPVFAISGSQIEFLQSTGKYRIQVDFTTKKITSNEIVSITLDFSGADTANKVIEVDLVETQEIIFSGLSSLSEWWIDSDFFKLEGGKYLFNAATGKYRITATLRTVSGVVHKFFRVEMMSGSALASWDNGAALWIIGTNIGKPTPEILNVNWSTGNGLCMAKTGYGKYRFTFRANATVIANTPNFKVFGQKNWGLELTKNNYKSFESSYFAIPGSDGNFGVKAGVTLDVTKEYVLLLDVSEGIDAAVGTITMK